MKRSGSSLLVALLAALVLLSTASCSSNPQTPAQRSVLVSDSKSTLDAMELRDARLKPMLEKAAGYAIFPSVGKGGFVVGGAFGRGSVYQGGGELAGYARVTQGSVGGVIGGRTYALLIVFESNHDLARFMNAEEFTFGAEATAIAIDEGSSATTRFDNGVAVFAMPKGGLMADASLSGQQFRFEKLDEMKEKSPATAELPRE